MSRNPFFDRFEKICIIVLDVMLLIFLWLLVLLFLRKVVGVLWGN